MAESRHDRSGDRRADGACFDVHARGGADLPRPSTDVKSVFVENPASVKLRAALLEALVLVVVLAGSTFFMASASFFNRQQRFSTFAILGGMGGAIFLAFVEYCSIPIDVITFFVLLFNFTIVGVLSLCSRGIPIILRQGYMVVLGIIAAVWLTKLPEWTTWVLLVALAVYDLVAVLSPHGPIKLLLELAESRKDEIPGLVYEARPTVSEITGSRGWSGDMYDISNIFENFDTARILENFDAARFNDLFEGSLLVASSPEIPPPIGNQLECSTVVGDLQSQIVDDEEMPPLIDVQNSGNESTKLGLGDFVFYSVLVGRAAMYDLMTVYACYLGIISGLGCTLILFSFPQGSTSSPYFHWLRCYLLLLNSVVVGAFNRRYFNESCFFLTWVKRRSFAVASDQQTVNHRLLTGFFVAGIVVSGCLFLELIRSFHHP